MVKGRLLSITEKNYLSYKIDNEIVIEDLHIDVLDLSFIEIEAHVSIRRSVISTLKLTTCWFLGGMTMEECVVHSYIDYQMGGHNHREIRICNNIFSDFFDFFDCHFDANVVVKNNVFCRGTNLLGNKGKGYENLFNGGFDICNNVGNTKVDC